MEYSFNYKINKALLFICTCFIVSCTNIRTKDYICAIDTVAIDVEKTSVDPYMTYHPEFWVSEKYPHRYDPWNVTITDKCMIYPDSVIINKKTVRGLAYRGRGFVMQKQIPIPKNVKKVDIKLQGVFNVYTDSVNTGEIWMSVIQKNGTEKIKETRKNISVDTTMFHPESGLNNWEISSLIDEKSTQISVVICCNAIGALCFFTTCNINIDGKPVETYTFKNENELSDEENKEFVLAIRDSLSIDDVSILGIGESIHGVSEFRYQTYSIIREKVLSGECKAILSELDHYSAAKINEYIHGEKKDTDFFVGITYEKNSFFIDLINFLREYNNRNKEKVFYGGIDIFYDPLIQPKIALLNRDSLMAENAAFLIDSLGDGKQIIITAHLGHLCKSQINVYSPPKPSLGYFLNQKYGSRYFLLAQLAASGKYRLLSEKDSCEIISVPLTGSIEQLCSATVYDTLFINKINDSNLWPKKVNYVRTVGSGWSLMQFSNMNICDEFDAISFFREVHPLKLMK